MIKTNVLELADEIINGRRLGRDDDNDFFFHADLNDLCSGADKIRSALCGDKFNLCTIINGKSGRCSENCKFCAQSCRHSTGINEYDFLSENDILENCKEVAAQGVHRFSIVTAGRTLSSSDFEKAVSVYKKLHSQCKIERCGSHGLLTYEQLLRLKEAGVKNYNANIETSRRNFPNICTTHTYDDKINCIKNAQKAGLNVCSGGIIGMGETWNDRLDMALSLAELNIDSIPINVLTPIKGTPLDGLELLSEEDVLRTAAMFRYINPNAFIRFAAGRNRMENSGKNAFLSGVNAALTGDMLTTSGNKIKDDKKMLLDMGFII